MKRLGSLAVISFIMLAAASAFAQQNLDPAPPETPYGYYGHVWAGLRAWDTGMIIGPMTLLTIIGVGLLIVVLVRGFEYGASRHWYRHASHPYGDIPYERVAVDMLEVRITTEEMDKAKFEEERKLLGR